MVASKRALIYCCLDIYFFKAVNGQGFSITKQMQFALASILAHWKVSKFRSKIAKNCNFQQLLHATFGGNKSTPQLHLVMFMHCFCCKCIHQLIGLNVPRYRLNFLNFHYFWSQSALIIRIFPRGHLFRAQRKLPCNESSLVGHIIVICLLFLFSSV